MRQKEDLNPKTEDRKPETRGEADQLRIIQFLDGEKGR